MSKPQDTIPTDWAAIEPHYRAGIRSLESIGKEFGVTKAAVFKHAKKHGWQRDLSERIRQSARAKVAKAEAQEAVNAAAVNDPGKRANDSFTVEVNAEAVAVVMLAHRKDIRRVRALLADQMAEAEHLTRQPEVYAQARDALADPDTTLPVIVERMAEFVTSLPQRVRLTKDIADTLRIVIALEREALGMDDKQPPPADPSSFENLVDLASEALEKYRLQPATPAKPAKSKTPFGRPA